MTPIRTRAQWGARPTKMPGAPLALPTPELWLHHTAGNERGVAGMLAIQRAHIAKGWADIGYSFVIDPTTRIVYEGRGVGVVGAHTEGHNSRAHGICVMGNYDTTQPSDTLIHDIADLVAYGHRKGRWPDHLTGGHRDTKPTDCPGRHLYAAIRRINAEAEAILAGDTPTTPEGDPMATADVEAAQRALNSWLTPDRQLRTDGDWGPASTAALRDILDGAARRIRELEAVATRVVVPTDADRKLAALKAALLEVVA